MQKPTAYPVDDFALVGSQVGTPVSSARHRRGSSSSTADINSGRSSSRSQGVHKPPSKQPPIRKTGSNPSLVHDKSAGNDMLRMDGGPLHRGPADELLAFFESKPVQPQIRKPQALKQHVSSAPKAKPAWGSNNSARSAASSARNASSRSETDKSDRKIFSKPAKVKPKTPKKFTHSVFQPTDSARTVSTVSDEELVDEVDALMAKINQDTTEQEIDHLIQSYENFNHAQSPRDKGEPAGNPPTGVAKQGQSFPEYGAGLTVNLSSLAKPGESSSLRSPKISNVTANSFSNGSMVNNLTVQAAKGPMPRISLSTMENSVQNFKTKSPVNQMQETAGKRQLQGATGSSKVGRSYNAEIAMADERKQRTMAACKIQRWYRKHGTKPKSSKAAVKQLLESKRLEREAAATSAAHPITTQDRRKVTHEEKARQKRQEAISELQKKREAKRIQDEQLAKEELKYLHSTGKVGKKPARPSGASAKPGPLQDTKTKSVKPKPKDSDSEDDRPSHRRSAQNSARSTNSTSQVKSALPSSRKSTREEATKNGFDSDNGLESPGASQAASEKTTVEDILATLKKLEEEHTFEKQKNQESKNEKPLAWLDELDKKSEKEDMSGFCGWDKSSSVSGAAATGGGAVGGHDEKDNVKRSGLLTDDKLKDVMAYLDDLDTADRVSQIEQDLTQVNQTLNFPALLMPSGEQLVELEQASAHAQEVTNAVLTQKMELEEKKRTVNTLQKALNQQRELTVRHAKETEKEFKQQMDNQKTYFEGKVSSQVAFIDQLIEDKKVLSERCDQLVREMKRAHEKYTAKFKAMEENHSVEMKKLKDFHEAAEKLRREKWFKETEKTVKEDTVRGMMPEIQTLIAKHKTEMRKIKSIHEAELLASDERAAKRYVQQTEELRDQLQREKEAACQHERELARQMYEKHMSEAEADFQQRRRRLYEEVREEKERQAEAARRQRQELDRLQRHLEDSHQAAVETLRKEYEKARDEQDTRHENEMRKLKEELKVEKSAWEENYMKKQETWMMQKERELKERVRQERDDEIESVITTLEDDQVKTRREYERNMENQMRRMKEKYMKEIDELEASEKAAIEKYNKSKAMLLENDGELQRLKVILQQKERDNEDYKKLLEKLNEERSHVSDVVRQEFADRIVSTEEENRRLKNELMEFKAQHKVEIERLKGEIELVKKRAEEEMEEVHSKVKQAIVKKEEIVQQLKQQYQAAVTRADHLEGLLEQQRKQLLGRK